MPTPHDSSAHGAPGPAAEAAVRSDAPDRAGLGALAQYRVEVARDRPRRLLLRGVRAAAPGLPLGLLLDWRLGLVAAAAVAAADWWRWWRRSEASAWRKGAAGERATARLLAPLASEGAVILHDRAIPTMRANIDHIVITPGGVWVVDSKRWHRRTRVHGLGARVWIGRRPAEAMLGGTAVTHGAVTGAVHTLTGGSVDVGAVVAVHGPRLPGAARPLVIHGVTMLRARQVRRWLRGRPVTLTPGEVEALGRALAACFPPYTSA